MKSLIYDTSTFLTDIATVSFTSIPTISFKKVLPPLKVASLIKGLFVNSENFYVSINCKQFYQDQFTPQTLRLSYNLAVVYTSDISLTSCYSMPSQLESAPLPLTAASLGTSLTSSIYTDSSETFIEDLRAYVTLDIIQSALMKVPWCN